MAFETNIPGHIVLGPANSNVWGTARLGDTWGEVTKLNVVRDADLNEIKNGAGGNLAVILTNLRFEMDQEMTIKADATLPEIGQQITFEDAGVKGNITGGIRLVWATAAAKTIAFRAAHWDAIGEVTAAVVALDEVAP
jgi:hypothetical protein